MNYSYLRFFCKYLFKFDAQFFGSRKLLVRILKILFQSRGDTSINFRSQLSNFQNDFYFRK
jgi:hypothetical protein